MRRFLFLVFVSGLCANVAAAIPITWTLQGVTFNDGGTASGSFVYDADTNAYSSINISTTAGSILTTPATYLFLNPNVTSDSTNLYAIVTASGDLTGVRLVGIRPSTALSDTGGTVTLSAGTAEGLCSNATCTSAPVSRSATAGSVVSGLALASAVPSLSTWAVFGTVLLLCASAFFTLRKNLA